MRNRSRTRRDKHDLSTQMERGVWDFFSARRCIGAYLDMANTQRNTIDVEVDNYANDVEKPTEKE